MGEEFMLNECCHLPCVLCINSNLGNFTIQWHFPLPSQIFHTKRSAQLCLLAHNVTRTIKKSFSTHNIGCFLLYLPQAWFLLLEQVVPAAQNPAGNRECWTDTDHIQLLFHLSDRCENHPRVPGTHCLWWILYLLKCCSLSPKWHHHPGVPSETEWKE